MAWNVSLKIQFSKLYLDASILSFSELKVAKKNTTEKSETNQIPRIHQIIFYDEKMHEKISCTRDDILSQVY